MHYIVTPKSPDQSFNQTKDWFLRHWSNRIQANVVLLNTDSSQLIQTLDEILEKDSEAQVFFLPTWAFPNLGAPNLFRKMTELGKLDVAIYKDKYKRIDENMTEEPFYLGGDALKKILSIVKSDINLSNSSNYLKFQKIIINHVINHVKKLGKTQEKKIFQGGYKENNKSTRFLPKTSLKLKAKVKNNFEKSWKNNLNDEGCYILGTEWNYLVNQTTQDIYTKEQIYVYNLDPSAANIGRSIANLYKSLDKIKEDLYDWSFLNSLRFRNVEDYPAIFRYTGRNKLGCKEIAKSLGVTVPETYQVVKEIQEIDWKSLPESYVIKPTNLDGAKKVYAIHKGVNIITRKKIKKLEIETDYKNYRTEQKEKELNRYLNKILKPKIIIEEFIPNVDGIYEIPIDYKCYVFQGKVKFILVIDGQRDRKRFAFYDSNWTQIPNDKYSTSTEALIKSVKNPKYLEKLIDGAERVAQAFRAELLGVWEGDFLRIDFYANDKDVYFGEIAIFPNGAKGKNVSSEGKILFGKYWLGNIP